MHTTTTHWKAEIADLRSLATAVNDHGGAPTRLSARTAARCLFGVVRLTAARFGQDAMQRACAGLARSREAWQSGLAKLPLRHDGTVDEPVQLLAAVALGVLPLAGAANVRAALSFWACEDDASVMQRVAAGAAA